MTNYSYFRPFIVTLDPPQCHDRKSSSSTKLMIFFTLLICSAHLVIQFLSTPVLMPGGLICIAFCLSVRLSVTGPKFRLENNSYLRKCSSQTYCMVHLQAIASHLPDIRMVVYGTGRSAHFKVKLHFFNYFSNSFQDMKSGTMQHWNTQKAPEVAIRYWQLKVQNDYFIF